MRIRLRGKPQRGATAPHHTDTAHSNAADHKHVASEGCSARLYLVQTWGRCPEEWQRAVSPTQASAHTPSHVRGDWTESLHTTKRNESMPRHTLSAFVAPFAPYVHTNEQLHKNVSYSVWRCQDHIRSVQHTSLASRCAIQTSPETFPWDTGSHTPAPSVHHSPHTPQHRTNTTQKEYVKLRQRTRRAPGSHCQTHSRPSRRRASHFPAPSPSWWRQTGPVAWAHAYAGIYMHFQV